MSVCTFLAADYPLPEVVSEKEYPLEIDIDAGTIWDGDADDNFCLLPFDHVQEYSERAYGVCLEWAYYTRGRAEQIISYIEDLLKKTDCVELWHVWLMDGDEARPIIRRCTVPWSGLLAEDIQELCEAEVWDRADKRNPMRPSFYCLTVTR